MVRVAERFQSRRRKYNKALLGYTVYDTADDIEAIEAMIEASPAVYDTLLRNDYTIEPVGIDWWQGTVSYGVEARKQAGRPPVFRFTTRGGTQHITQSFETVAGYAVPGQGPAPDFRGAIGVNQDGTIEGVDDEMPVFAWEESHCFELDAIDDAYKAILYRLTNKVNLDSFRMCAPGECRFLGTEGTTIGQECWELTYHFAASPNVVNLPVGEITVTAKRGWDYLWVYRETIENVNPKMLIQRPKFAYVERTKHYELFSQLGIGI